jgi:hypothetical protein
MNEEDSEQVVEVAASAPVEVAAMVRSNEEGEEGVRRKFPRVCGSPAYVPISGIITNSSLKSVWSPCI